MNKYIHEGYRSIAYVKDSRIILKGKNEHAYKTYHSDYNNLLLLNKYIKSVEIPSDIKLINKTKRFPYGGLSYNLIEGEVFNIKKITEYNLNSIILKLSEFLNELSMIPVSYSNERIIAKEKLVVNKNLVLLEKYVSKDIYLKLEIWSKKYFKKLNIYKNFSYVHGDLWYENYIIDNVSKNLKGIIDFENFGIFFKEYDFVPFLYISEDFTKKVIEKYKHQVDYDLIKLLLIRREVCSFEYMLKYEPNDVQEQIGKIVNIL